jgi:hypothetical protein
VTVKPDGSFQVDRVVSAVDCGIASDLSCPVHAKPLIGKISSRSLLGLWCDRQRFAPLRAASLSRVNAELMER